jgi:S1-C subfamily serine protease
MEIESMKTWKLMIPVAATLLLAGQALAQTDEEQAMREAEARQVEIETKLREAEKQMEAAARTIAELTADKWPQVIEIKKRIVDMSGKPRLGVTISGDDEGGPVEGVSVMGVTPGSAADDAGIRAGDVLTSVNSETLSAATAMEANEKLLVFMKGVEEGDKVEVEYLRNGNVGKVEVEPRVVGTHEFMFAGGDFSMPHMPEVGMHFGPEQAEMFTHRFGWGRHGWGDMELVELNEGLGKYFGTDEGLLVVSAPESNALQLEDGDVIKSIDGREPKSVGHAMRILGSYQAGETLELSIMRDKRRKKLEIEMPADERTGKLYEFLGRPPAVPARAPQPPLPREIATGSEST